MKTTAQRLSEVYCLPKGAKEWGMFGLIDIGTNYAVWSVDGKATVTDCNLPELFTQIPVQHFIDLMEDNIVAWRLVEDGFVNTHYGYRLNMILVTHPDPATGVQVEIDNDMPVTISANCKTYTDLITLINLLK
jgi:hypothetical protein